MAALFAATLSVLSGCSGASDVQSGSGPSTTSAGGGASSGTGGDGESTGTSPVLFTQGTVTVPDGEAGKLSVVAISAPTDDFVGGAATVPVLVRNNTDTPLGNIEVNGTARGPDGALAGSGSTNGSLEPRMLKPGQWGFGNIYFNEALPAGAKVEATASGNEPGSDFFDVGVQLTINEVDLVPGESSNYVGILANTDGKKAISNASVAIGCFDPASNLIEVFIGSSDGEAVPGGTASFSVPAEGPTCAAIAAAASGFGS
ncbi:MAG: hypothetical protein ACKO5A_07420 [Actinomycetota bacterium]